MYGCGPTSRRTNRPTDRPTDGRTERTDRQADTRTKQIDKQTGRTDSGKKEDEDKITYRHETFIWVDEGEKVYLSTD